MVMRERVLECSAQVDGILVQLIALSYLELDLTTVAQLLRKSDTVYIKTEILNPAVNQYGRSW